MSWRFLAMLFVLAGGLAAAEDAPSLERANQLLNDSQWTPAAEMFTALSRRTPGDGSVRTGLGEAFLQSGHGAEARDAFQKALDLGFRPVLNQVNLARVAAVAGRTDDVLSIMKTLIAAGQGGRARPMLAAQPEFASLKADATFRKLVDEEMKPCRDAVYRQFDFWIGTWNVTTRDGQPAGSNEVTNEQGGCLLVEHWKDTTGQQTGTSFNYYDVRDAQWHQLYLDNSGNAGAFPAMAGGLAGGRMVLLTDKAVSPLSRWTWYVLAPGKVRQMAEQSTDGGKTWAITWDSVYAKAEEISPARACAGPEYAALDFWIGDWDVASPKGEHEGTNRIEKALSGCAVIEHWKDDLGHEGQSLFYHDPAKKLWKQVWVTDAGPIKEKALLPDYAGPGLRFQGELPRRSGPGTYLDRTTLKPLSDGCVSQVIEISIDGGATWKDDQRWEGIYTRKR